MSKFTNETKLIYEGLVIRFDKRKQMFNLVDMWKAAGSDKSKKPVEWLRQMGTADLLLALCNKYGEDIKISEKPNFGVDNYRKKSRDWINEVKKLSIKKEILIAQSTEKSFSHKEAGTYGILDIAIAYAEKLSPKFHTWIIQVAKERIEEEQNPELSLIRGKDRAIKGWKRRGKSDDWIQDRINSIENYKQHTKILAEHGVGMDGKRNGFAECADAFNQEILGYRSKQAKTNLGLQKKSDRLRDHLTRKQLTALSFAEALADDEIETKNLQGNTKCKLACVDAATRVSNAASKTTYINT